MSRLVTKTSGLCEQRPARTKSVETCFLLRSLRRIQKALDESDLGSPSSVLSADRHDLLGHGLKCSLSQGVVDD